MRKILILGSSGAGKSTLAVKLGAVTGLPVLHLDAHFWQAGWREPPRDEWRQRVIELARREAWIMDGSYGSTLPERLDAADTVICLDLPRIQCLYRVVLRGVFNRGKTRADLHPGCVEQLPDWAFLRWTWSYPHAERPLVLEQLRIHADAKTIVVSRSTQQIAAFLRSAR